MGIYFENLIHSFAHYLNVSFRALLKSKSLQKVAYSFGRLSMNDYISKIAVRTSERYFLCFLSIYKVSGFFKFFFEIRIFDR
jgi:hypothetical protein